MLLSLQSAVPCDRGRFGRKVGAIGSNARRNVNLVGGLRGAVSWHRRLFPPGGSILALSHTSMLLP